MIIDIAVGLALTIGGFAVGAAAGAAAAAPTARAEKKPDPTYRVRLKEGARGKWWVQLAEIPGGRVRMLGAAPGFASEAEARAFAASLTGGAIAPPAEDG